MIMRLSALFLSAITLVAPLAAGTKVFTPDTNHSFFGFKAATVLFEVPGRFQKYKLNIEGDPADLSTVKIRVEFDTKSINTANSMRDNHLRTEDFFDAAKYPKIIFTSEKAWREGGKVLVQGTLNMHGVEKPLQIAFEEATGLNGAGASTWSYKATLPISRKDFGIGADSVAAKISLKDEVSLNLLLVGFFNDAPAAPAAKAAKKK
jgi:polyisoprenoid-binding protein YceI